jgi:hypothetical protein
LNRQDAKNAKKTEKDKNNWTELTELTELKQKDDRLGTVWFFSLLFSVFSWRLGGSNVFAVHKSSPRYLP